MERRAFCALVAVLAGCAVLAFGQAVSGTLLGTITDSTGASAPGAKTGFGNDWASFLLDQPSQVGRDLATSR